MIRGMCSFLSVTFLFTTAKPALRRPSVPPPSLFLPLPSPPQSVSPTRHRILLCVGTRGSPWPSWNYIQEDIDDREAFSTLLLRNMHENRAKLENSYCNGREGCAISRNACVTKLNRNE